MTFGGIKRSAASVVLVVLGSIGSIYNVGKLIACVVIGVERTEAVAVLATDGAGRLLGAGRRGLYRVVLASDYRSTAGMHKIVLHKIDCRWNEYLALIFVSFAIKLSVILAADLAYRLRRYS
jgi:hypothetical protein